MNIRSNFSSVEQIPRRRPPTAGAGRGASADCYAISDVFRLLIQRVGGINRQVIAVQRLVVLDALDHPARITENIDLWFFVSHGLHLLSSMNSLPW
jgi:hypothetical protein